MELLTRDLTHNPLQSARSAVVFTSYPLRKARALVVFTSSRNMAFDVRVETMYIDKKPIKEWSLSRMVLCNKSAMI